MAGASADAFEVGRDRGLELFLGFCQRLGWGRGGMIVVLWSLVRYGIRTSVVCLFPLHGKGKRLAEPTSRRNRFRFLFRFNRLAEGQDHVRPALAA